MNVSHYTISITENLTGETSAVSARLGDEQLTQLIETLTTAIESARSESHKAEMKWANKVNKEIKRVVQELRAVKTSN